MTDLLLFVFFRGEVFLLPINVLLCITDITMMVYCNVCTVQDVLIGVLGAVPAFFFSLASLRLTLISNFLMLGKPTEYK